MRSHSVVLLLTLSAAVVAPAAQAPPPGADHLQGTEWQLVRFQGGDGKVLTPDDAAKYTISFGREGRVAVRFDCNRGAGTWTSAAASQIVFGPMAITRAACPQPSLHDHLVRQWPHVRSYVIRDGRLFLSLMADGGTYEFASRAADIGSVVRYRCGTTEIGAAPRGEGLDLTVGAKTFALAHTPSASGARYASSGSPEVVFWNKGRTATLTIGSTTYPECVRQ